MAASTCATRTRGSPPTSRPPRAELARDRQNGGRLFVQTQLRLLENPCRPRGAATNQVGSAGHLERLHVVAHRRVEYTRTVVLKFQRHREIGEVHVRRRDRNRRNRSVADLRVPEQLVVGLVVLYV